MKTLLFLVVTAFFTLSYAQVKLNEVMVRPGGNQGLIVFNGNSGNEYIELYNPSCTPVNVSGYFIACRQEFAGTTSGGAFRIPNVTAAVIAPGGHLVLGTATSSADANSIDIKLPDYSTNYCLNNSGFNFILANADGWVALYDAAGVPVDAIYWSSAAGNISQAADFGGVPCVPAGSPSGVTLESAQQINSGFPGVLTYAGANPAAGLTYSRIPDGGNWQTGVNPSVNDLTVGNCNGGNCQSVSSIAFSTSAVSPSCNNANGSITVNVTSPGTPAYAWSANAATGNVSTANNLAAGSYSVTVTQNGCSKDTTIVLNSSNGVNISLTNPVNPTCAGNDGSVTVGLSGGTPPYNVVIDTGGTPISLTVPFAITQAVNNVPAGTVSVTVTDGTGCTDTASLVLTAPANCCTVSLSAVITQATCGLADGSIQATALNGSGNYSYSWSANASTGNVSSANNLLAGVYLLTVTDNGFSNCNIDTSFTITNPGSPVLDSIVTNNETCAGTGDGSIQLYLSGGTGVLNYTWSANANTGSSALASNLTAGNYGYTVTDAANCQVTGNVSLQANVCCTLQASASATGTTCGLANGSISVAVTTPGQAPYSYSLNGGTPQSLPDFSNLNAGNYLIIVADANGCIDTVTATVAAGSNNLSIAFQITNVSCANGSDGAVTANVSGGVGSLSYSWSNSQLIPTITALQASAYSLTVTDSDGCTATGSAQVTEPLPLTIQLGNDTSLCAVTPVLITAPAGFASYAWSTGETAGFIVANDAGAYAVTVSDNNGCTAADSISITLSDPIQLEVGDDITVYEGNSAGIFPTVTGNANGQFVWEPAATLSCSNCVNTVALPIDTTLYVLTFTDNSGCSVRDSIQVNVVPVGDIFFPSAFSPNDDGNNDIYRPLGNSVKNYLLKIFNRWGELVFESTNFNDGWDGTYKAAQQPLGVYVYDASVTLFNDYTRKYKGSITLIR